jgi:hypothetical protein
MTSLDLDPIFESPSLQIGYLMGSINNGALAIPDFQRSFIWDTKATIELLQSVMSRYPIGTLLFWKQGPDTETLAARAVEGAPALAANVQPATLILDGQQRMTALYRVLTGQGDERYFVKLGLFVDEDWKPKDAPQVKWDDALLAYDVDGQSGASSGSNVDPESQAYQFDECIYPLAKIPEFDTWLDKYARTKSADDAEEERIKRGFRGVRDKFLRQLNTYGLPVVSLPSNTPIEAVCTIFETLNRTGKPLGAFELVTARLYPKNIRLRDLWEKALDDYPLLQKFDIQPYALLQAISLRALGSAQRADVLTNLKANHIEDNWQDVASAFEDVLEEIDGYGVVGKRWLPYGMLLVPIAAVWPEVKALKGFDKGKARDRISQYFWCSTFMTNFDQGANSQAGADYARLKTWVIDDKSPKAEADDKSLKPPEAIEKFNLSESQIFSATVRRKALHAGIMALTINAGAKDFYNGEKITPTRVVERKIESHHVFPRGYLNSPDSELMLNRALIDWQTNKLISKRPPSEYLEKMKEVYSEDRISDVFSSHAIDFGPEAGMRTDDYQAFLKQRLAAIVGLIENVTGKKITRDVTKDENIEDVSGG